MPKARNNCVKKFLELNMDYIVFIDSDLYFQDDAIIKLLKHDKDIILGAYPYRSDDSLDFPVELILDSNKKVIKENDLIRIKAGPTGLMIIKKEVFSEMKKFNKYKTIKNEYFFFDTGMLYNNDGEWYGEDTLFCLRAQKHNFKIFCDPDINFMHIGRQAKQGNYKKFLQEKNYL